jgi:hypothetical protein
MTLDTFLYIIIEILVYLEVETIQMENSSIRNSRRKTSSHMMQMDCNVSCTPSLNHSA